MKMTVLPIIHNLGVGESSSKELLLVPWDFIASTGERGTVGQKRPSGQAPPTSAGPAFCHFLWCKCERGASPQDLVAFYESDWSGKSHSKAALCPHCPPPTPRAWRSKGEQNTNNARLGSKGSGQRQDCLSHSRILFSQIGSSVLGWPQTCYGTEGDLEYLIPLCLPFPSAGIIGVTTTPGLDGDGMEPRALYMLGKHSIN